MTVSQTGFETSVAEHVIVQIQQNTRLPITLKVGSTNESLVVQAQAPLLQTEDVSVGQTISGVIKDDLPVSDRDFNRLAVLTVGRQLLHPIRATRYGQRSLLRQRHLAIPEQLRP